MSGDVSLPFGCTPQQRQDFEHIVRSDFLNYILGVWITSKSSKWPTPQLNRADHDYLDCKSRDVMVDMAWDELHSFRHTLQKAFVSVDAADGVM